MLCMNISHLEGVKAVSKQHNVAFVMGVSIHWTGLLDWTTGLEYWTGMEF